MLTNKFYNDQPNEGDVRDAEFVFYLTWFGCCGFVNVTRLEENRVLKPDIRVFIMNFMFKGDLECIYFSV